MKKILLLATALVLSGCASTKQFLRPLNSYYVIQAEQQMVDLGYVPVVNSDKPLFVPPGPDATVYSEAIGIYLMDREAALDNQRHGQKYTIPAAPETDGLETIKPSDFFNKNFPWKNFFANIVDTLWDGLLATGVYVAGDELDNNLSGNRSGDRRDEVAQNPDPSFTADAGGNITANCISSGNFRAGGNVNISNSSCGER